MREIYVARHGHREDFAGASRTPTWELSAGRPHDPALSGEGQQQAQDLGRRLRDCGIEWVYASPFLRTVETAHLAAEILGAGVRIEEGLGEWLNPEWFPVAPSLLPPADLKARFPRVDATYRSRLPRRYPEPDEELDVWPRVARTVHEVLSTTTGPLLLIGHGASVGGVVRALCAVDAPRLAPTCALFHCRQQESGDWDLLLSGCTRHLTITEESLQAR